MMKRGVFFVVLFGVADRLRAAPSGDPSLLFHMPFDEGGGTVAADCSRNALEGDMANVQWATGAFGCAARFGGTNAFVELPPVPGLNGATQFTLSVWATWEDPATRRYPNLLTSRNWSPGGLMLFVSDGGCSFRMGRPGERAGTPGNQWRETGVPLLGEIPANRWTHLCVTFDRPHLTAYVNGRPVGHAEWPYAVEVDSLRLGGWQGEVCHAGLIDDVRIYGRPLTAAEVQAMASDPLRASAAYQTVDESRPGAEPAVRLSNGHADLSLDARGQVVSLRARALERELLARPQPFVSARLKDGRVLSARTLKRDGNTLTFGFARGLGEACVEVDVRHDFITFTVRSLTLANAASLTFCSLPVAATRYRGAMANMLSDDEAAVCLRGYDVPVEMGIRADVLSVTTTEAHGLSGWRAGLAAGTKREMPGMLRSMAEAAGVPASRLGGPWALGAEENRGSYLFADLAYAATDDWIELARRGGFSTLHIHGWWQTLGHYDVRTNLYPRGLADMKEAVARIHAAGLRAGIHTLTACIEPRDAWVTPEASADLIPFDSYTLARSLSPTDTVLYVNEPPSARHDVVFTYTGNGNAIRIGSEIVQYGEVRREPPYAFLRCTRGAFKTRVAAHAAGERADYLQQRYIAFYPQPDSPLADRLAACIANVFNTCRLDQLYFDGSEGMMSRYGIDAMRHCIFRKLQGDPLIEASCHGAHNWWFHSRLGAWDHPVWAAKRFHDQHVAVSARYRDTDLLEPQMGWWAPRQPSPLARGHFLDEMEYFACKNLGLDAAMSVQGVNVSRAPLPFHIERQFTLLGWYEHLRLARYFDAATVSRIAAPGKDFRLRQDRDGHWRFTPVEMDAHRITAVGNGSEAWRTVNPHHAQPLCARVEALYAVAPYDSPKGVPALAASDFGDLKVDTASPAVTLALDTVREDVRGTDVNLRLRAANAGTTSTGAWARAALAVPAPYRNLKGNAAFGVWVRGDGSGALLNVQIGTPREFMHTVSDHLVTLDFRGWRYVELLARERDVARLGEAVWPYGGLYDMYRNPLDLSHISQVTLYLNNLPPGRAVEVAVSPVMALPVSSVSLAASALVVNGQRLALPFTLASGAFVEVEPDGRCTHYSERGEPLASAALALPAVRTGVNEMRFECELPQGASARAEVTASTFGEPFGTAQESRAIQRRELVREYEMPRFFPSPTSLADGAWDVAVRPGERAALEIELCGAMADPVVTVADQEVRFPVTLREGERLLCLDGRHWRVLDAARMVRAEGDLQARVPLLAGGPHRVSFACGAPERAQVKLVKVYE